MYHPWPHLKEPVWRLSVSWTETQFLFMTYRLWFCFFGSSVRVVLSSTIKDNKLPPVSVISEMMQKEIIALAEPTISAVKAASFSTHRNCRSETCWICHPNLPQPAIFAKARVFQKFVIMKTLVIARNNNPSLENVNTNYNKKNWIFLYIIGSFHPK